jgi:hypothetical protein
METAVIAATYPGGATCMYCKMSKLRHDLEFQVTTMDKGQVIDSSYSIKNVCAHCFTVCDELQNFLCAKCGQVTPYEPEIIGSELKLFERIFSENGKFGDFYKRLISEGLTEGKRYCLPCTYKLWEAYLENPSSLREELEKPKSEFQRKKV